MVMNPDHSNKYSRRNCDSISEGCWPKCQERAMCTTVLRTGCGERLLSRLGGVERRSERSRRCGGGCCRLRNTCRCSVRKQPFKSTARGQILDTNHSVIFCKVQRSPRSG